MQQVTRINGRASQSINDNEKENEMKDELANTIGDSAESSTMQQTKTPTGDLMTPMNTGTIAQEIDDVSIPDIRGISSVPDYVDPTTAIYPSFAKTPDGTIYILDGSEMVYAARDKGETSIRGIIYHLNTDSATELEIQKASIRMMPTAGLPRYPEAVRNVAILKRSLMESSENVVANTHGGDRKSALANGALQQNVRDVIAARTGKDEASIGNYLSHGEYLTDEAFVVLVNSEHVTKRFFERVQPHKRQLIKRLREQKETQEEITEQVSAKIMEAAKAYAGDKTKKITSFLPDPKVQASGEGLSLADEGGQVPETLLEIEEESTTGEEPEPGRSWHNMQDELARLGNMILECSKEQDVTHRLVSDVSKVANGLLEIADDMHRLIEGNSIDKLVKDAA